MRVIKNISCLDPFQETIHTFTITNPTFVILKALPILKNFKITQSYRIIVLLIFLLLTVKFVHSQEVQEIKITKTFNRTPITEFFSYLEETCGITFFYREEWILSSEINGAFKNTPLSQVLNQVFKEKELNFKFFEKDMA